MREAVNLENDNLYNSLLGICQFPFQLILEDKRRATTPSEFWMTPGKKKLHKHNSQS